jgi:hypothetical protein
MRTIYSAIRTYREERDVWESAYYELSDKAEAFRSDLESQVALLRQQLETERSAWRAAVRKGKSPGIGVFVGAGYTHGGVDAVVGIGVVWRLF